MFQDPLNDILFLDQGDDAHGGAAVGALERIDLIDLLNQSGPIGLAPCIDESPVDAIRQRLYRRRCRHNEQLDQTIALFNERRSELEAVLAPEMLTERTRKTALKYLDYFFVTVNNLQKLNKQVIGVCRGSK